MRPGSRKTPLDSSISKTTLFAVGILCVLWLGTPALTSETGTPPLQLLYPLSTTTAVKAPNQHVIGLVDTMRVATVVTARQFDVTEEIKVVPATLAQDFARLVKRLIPREGYLTRFEYESRNARSRKHAKTMIAEFDIGKKMDLQSFWESAQFRSIYSAAARDTTATHVQVAAEGYIVDSISVRSDSHRVSFGEFFVFRVGLKSGINDVTVTAYDTRGEELQKLPVSLAYKSEIDRKIEIPSSYTTEHFHAADREAVCAKCHPPEPATQPSARKVSTTRSCFPCHKWVTEGTLVHGPVATWSCLYCHNGQYRDGFRYTAPSDSTTETLCFECHVEMRKASHAKPYIHGPVASGECSLCHNPHSSREQGLIRLSAGELCVSCHGERYALDHPVVNHPARGVADPTSPGRELSCVSCHAPHYSDSPSLFYSATGLYELCQQCHQK